MGETLSFYLFFNLWMIDIQNRLILIIAILIFYIWLKTIKKEISIYFKKVFCMSWIKTCLRAIIFAKSCYSFFYPFLNSRNITAMHIYFTICDDNDNSHWRIKGCITLIFFISSTYPSQIKFIIQLIHPFNCSLFPIWPPNLVFYWWLIDSIC